MLCNLVTFLAFSKLLLAAVCKTTLHQKITHLVPSNEVTLVFVIVCQGGTEGISDTSTTAGNHVAAGFLANKL